MLRVPVKKQQAENCSRMQGRNLSAEQGGNRTSRLRGDLSSAALVGMLRATPDKPLEK